MDKNQVYRFESSCEATSKTLELVPGESLMTLTDEDRRCDRFYFEFLGFTILFFIYLLQAIGHQ